MGGIVYFFELGVFVLRFSKYTASLFEYFFVHTTKRFGVDSVEVPTFGALLYLQNTSAAPLREHIHKSMAHRAIKPHEHEIQSQ